MNEKEINKTSKFLSLVLRHEPQQIGIELDENGWVSVTELIEKLNLNNKKITFDELKIVVDTNNKKRFSFNAYFSKIRANQGHSLEIDLNYEPKEPPIFLYHGTATKNLESIFENGIQKQNRHHVHLSDNVDTAFSVGTRHGKPVVLKIKAHEMYEKEIIFYLSANNVWLVDEVLPEYIMT